MQDPNVPGLIHLKTLTFSSTTVLHPSLCPSPFFSRLEETAVSPWTQVLGTELGSSVRTACTAEPPLSLNKDAKGWRLGKDYEDEARTVSYKLG